MGQNRTTLAIACLAALAPLAQGCILNPTAGYTRPFEPLSRRDGVAVNTYTALAADFEPPAKTGFPFAFDLGPALRMRFSGYETQVSLAAAGRLVYPGARSRVSVFLMPGFHVLQASHLAGSTDVSTLSPFADLGMSIGIVDTLALTISGGAEYDVYFASDRQNHGYWSAVIGPCLGGCYLPNSSHVFNSR